MKKDKVYFCDYCKKELGKELNLVDNWIRGTCTVCENRERRHNLDGEWIYDKEVLWVCDRCYHITILENAFWAIWRSMRLLIDFITRLEDELGVRTDPRPVYLRYAWMQELARDI